MISYKKIRKGDTIRVIAGKDRAGNKTGNVIEVNREKGKILVQGVNLVKKTFRKSKKNPSGGIKEIEAFFDISNVMLICPKCKKETRVGFKINEKDEKRRFCKKCKEVID